MRWTRLLGRLAGTGAIVALAAASGCGSTTETASLPTPVVAPTVTPSPAATTAAGVDAGTGAPMRIEYGTEPENFGDLLLPDSEAPPDGHPVVVLIHGGFWRQQFDLTLMDPLAEDLVERGYATWNIEYRRVGGSGGWPETGDDVAAAIDALADIAADHPLDLDRIVTVGHSAGGHLGLWALDNEVRVAVERSVGLGAVVDLGYFVEAQGLLGGSPQEVPDVYDAAAPVLDPDRVVLIQGSADGIVPTASLQPAVDAGVTIVDIEGDDHFDLIDPASASWAAAVAAIDESIG